MGKWFVYLILSTAIQTQAQTQTPTSSVYSCNFAEDYNNFSSVRMKKYFDPAENMYLGKVDVLQNLTVVESTPVRVYQIPLLDNQTYVQLWNSKEVRVDAQLSYSQGGREFRATYTKNETKKTLVCRELRD
ncbi:cell wall hydrolase [Bdellovibrio bacteriovorus]|uniref:cell wall hydrolase n=1 Tax=Bdellovibrio bacteriovorus TaxID=959 RepID=UPI0035A5D0E1